METTNVIDFAEMTSMGPESVQSVTEGRERVAVRSGERIIGFFIPEMDFRYLESIESGEDFDAEEPSDEREYLLTFPA